MSLARAEPAISVLLPFRDAARTVVQAAESALSSPLVRELVAIDDGSVDGGATRVRQLGARDPRVRLVESHGVGVARALALGVSHARHGLLGRMDADDLSLPGRFEASAALLASDPHLGAVGTQVRVESETPKPGLEAYVAWQNGLVLCGEHAAARFVEAPLCHPSTLLRRDALALAGGYVDAPWPEDYDLWLRLVEAGFRLAKVPRVHLTWRHREGRATFADPRCAEPALLAARAHYLARHLGPLLDRGGRRAASRAGDLGRRQDGEAPREGARSLWAPARRVGRHRPYEGRPFVASCTHRIARGAPRGRLCPYRRARARHLRPLGG